MHKGNLKQQGFVSIIVAATLMVLLSLVTIGFSRVMQREQRQALDRQLSTQAFYAAETAVNDVYSAIANNATIAEEKTDCDVTDWPNTGDNGLLDSLSGNVAYTCLKYDQTPTDLVFTDSITTSTSKIFPVQPKDDTDTVSTITFEWSGEESSTLINGASDDCTVNPRELPQSFVARAIPMLRIDVIDASSSLDREDLIDNAATLYLFPKSCGTNSGSIGTYQGVNNAGQIVDVDCSGGTGCSFTVTGLSQNRYNIRMRSVYTNVGTLRVTATSSSGNFEFKNAQTVVDATGKANDVLRRIEVRISNSPDYRNAEAAIEAADGVCKLIEVAPASPASSSLVRNSNCY